MVYYMISNETYGRYPETPEVFEGKRFRSFSQSHLLTFVRQTTNAEIINSEALLHFQIACLNHTIDVICTAPPEIVFTILSRKLILSADNAAIYLVGTISEYCPSAIPVRLCTLPTGYSPTLFAANHGDWS